MKTDRILRKRKEGNYLDVFSLEKTENVQEAFKREKKKVYYSSHTLQKKTTVNILVYFLQSFLPLGERFNIYADVPKSTV